ncbi:MAG: bifunctional folylpolyglutamate synthase/dihydrofolate synthase, partial [Polyangiaceae bacterium]|nr:bifunctional folylpolyglutamate synthase/dihydrofolate synthase [Polyangiaceae bacterium]
MSSGYAEALSYLYALEPRGIRLELDRVEEALALRGAPTRGQRFVHVAGSNGKGSVSAIVERALRAGGYRTGLYTSPHLHRFCERVRIDGVPIAEEEVVRRVDSLRSEPELPPLTFFEHATILAFEAFRDARVDVVVLEVGLGGRLDATNVVDPLAVAITNVSLEHQKFLGDSLEQIAFEKAGVLKTGVPAVTGARDPAVVEVLEERAREVGAPLSFVGRDFGLEGEGEALLFRSGDGLIDRLSIGQGGPWVRANAEVALATLL